MLNRDRELKTRMNFNLKFTAKKKDFRGIVRTTTFSQAGNPAIRKLSFPLGRITLKSVKKHTFEVELVSFNERNLECKKNLNGSSDATIVHGCSKLIIKNGLKVVQVNFTLHKLLTSKDVWQLHLQNIYKI